MTRIKLIVTGDVEEIALAESLQQLFPVVFFEATKHNGFTSAPVRVPAEPGSKAQALLREAFAAADASEENNELPFDFSVVIDDLELCNQGNEVNVVEHMRQATQHLLAALNQPSLIVAPKGKKKGQHRFQTHRDRVIFFQERCSFHLLAPMVESLFFADPVALQRAGTRLTPPMLPSQFDPSAHDPEDFITNDAAYLAMPKGATHPDKRTSDPKKNKPIQWAATDPAQRARHPKHYLSYLLDTKQPRELRPYIEKEHGKVALEKLSWRQALSQPSYTQFARALVDDVAHMLGVSLPFLATGTPHTLTCYKPTQRNRTLRNA